MIARLATAMIALAIALAAGCGASTPNPPKSPEPTAAPTSEPTMPPTSDNETPPEPCIRQPDPIADLDTAAREVLSVVEHYVAAITARDEPTAARYICNKKNGGLLWISSAGKRITVREVQSVSLTTPASAMVEIQVEGKEPSPVVLHKIQGSWCVYL